jgi:flagellum-specific peptidoglycan hydrolase FlgJ
MKTILLILLLSTATAAQIPDFSSYKRCEYLTFSYEYALIIYHKFNIPPAVTMSICILESGYGTSEAATLRNNHFGIENGARKYKFIYNSFEDFGFLIACSERYRPVIKQDINNPFKWLEMLQICGYNWRDSWREKCEAIIKQYKLNELNF